MTETNFRASLLLLAYNQERFIRDAIESAFAQDAEDLEIILSDDASADGTYEIMQEMAARYEGPHTIRLNRNPENLGVNNHINMLVETARSDTCVLFPGDDSSVPSRVSKLLAAMDAQDVVLVHSDASTMDAQGEPTEPWHRRALFFRTTNHVDAAGSTMLYLGATAAFKRSLFRKYGPLPGFSKAFEDLITGFRAALEGRIGFVDEALVRYRNDVGISNDAAQPGKGTIKAARKRRAQKIRGLKTMFAQRLKDAKTFGLPAEDDAVKVLEAELFRMTVRDDYHGLPWFAFLRRYRGAALRITLSELNHILRRR